LRGDISPQADHFWPSLPWGVAPKHIAKEFTMAGKSDSLRYGTGRASLSGPKTKQARIRAGAHRFTTALREAGYGVGKWENVTNKHYQAVADKMKGEGLGNGRIAEVFSSARHVCRAYGNDRIADSNAAFDIIRGSIANQTSKAVDPKVIKNMIHNLETTDSYEHAARVAAQIRLQYELGLRREEAAKVDLLNDWDRDKNTIHIQYGSKGGRRRFLDNLSAEQEHALELALPFVSPSDRPGIYNLMPEGMGDEWQNRLSYAARKHGLTKRDCGFTLHGNRHERFRQVYEQISGFLPPNCHPTQEAFFKAAQEVAGDDWAAKDAEARNTIERLAGHSEGRRDISNAYLGRS